MLLHVPEKKEGEKSHRSIISASVRAWARKRSEKQSKADSVLCENTKINVKY